MLPPTHDFATCTLVTCEPSHHISVVGHLGSATYACSPKTMPAVPATHNACADTIEWSNEECMHGRLAQTCCMPDSEVAAVQVELLACD
jgi:hypothetical protein